MNGQRCTLTLLSIAATRSPIMRLVALSGLLICSLAATLRAANNDADRFLETAKELIQAINSDDSAAIQASFNAQMQQFLPPDKAMPFFRGIVTAKGKLKEAGAPRCHRSHCHHASLSRARSLGFQNYFGSLGQDRRTTRHSSRR